MAYIRIEDKVPCFLASGISRDSLLIAKRYCGFQLFGGITWTHLSSVFLLAFGWTSFC